LQDRHRCLAREPGRPADQVLVQHHVADDLDATPTHAVEDGGQQVGRRRGARRGQRAQRARLNATAAAMTSPSTLQICSTVTRMATMHARIALPPVSMKNTACPTTTPTITESPAITPRTLPLLRRVILATASPTAYPSPAMSKKRR